MTPDNPQDSPPDTDSPNANPGEIPTPVPVQLPAQRTLWEATGFAAAISIVVLLLFILPAEYGIDPTGFGAAIGIDSIAAPSDAGASMHGVEAHPYRADTAEIVIPAQAGLEYKFLMNQSSGLVYAWNATGPLYFDFHGEPTGDTSGYFESYEIDTRTRSDGSFNAPFAGTHGWYWRNDGTSAVTVHLSTAGHYSIVGKI